MHRLKLTGKLFFRCWNPDGSLAWEETVYNAINGLLDLLNVYFHGSTQTATWYLGLINNTGTPSLVSTDTMSSHSGWVELTSYSESVRQTWPEGAAAGDEIASTAAAIFTVNASCSIYGAFLSSDSTKSGTTGNLWAAGAFPAPHTLISGQKLDVYYSVTGQEV